MGVYSEYLDMKMSFQQLTEERKNQLRRIAELRGRDILVVSANLNNPRAPISLGIDDILPLADQLANLSGEAIDLILETPGGSGEVAEHIVRLIRGKYPNKMGIIVPGNAMSAGTLIAMAADEILMGPSSALGPIDAQIRWQGKTFSADALLSGFERIKQEVVKSNGFLNKAYIPILQAISPGELEAANNAQRFGKHLVTQWLAQYKFKNWVTHSSSGKPVTPEEREARAEEIAHILGDHGRWMTHGRFLLADDLRSMRLEITDYSSEPELEEAIRRYHTLLQMTFATNIYKVFETTQTQIYRAMAPPAPPMQQSQEQF